MTITHPAAPSDSRLADSRLADSMLADSRRTDSMLADRYRLGPLIGSGGMARVYRAQDTLLGRDVAVKVLRDWCADEVTVQRFGLEAKALGSLDHPHLVGLLDAGFEDQHRYLVLDLVEGGNLSDRIAQGAMNPDTVLRLAVPLADALAHVHRAGIVHRDLKPSNILLDESGPHLADFGIARLLDETTRHTATGLLVGTAAYLSPEQAQGEGATAASDVYALGLVLLECLTGHQAYQGTPVEAAIARINRAPEIPDALGAGWVRILRAMTAKDPAARPTAEELRAMLLAFAAERGASLAAPVTGTAPAVEPVVVPTVPSVPSVPTVATSLFPAVLRETRPQARPQAGPGRTGLGSRRRAAPLVAAGVALAVGLGLGLGAFGLQAAAGPEPAPAARVGAVAVAMAVEPEVTITPRSAPAPSSAWPVSTVRPASSARGAPAPATKKPTVRGKSKGATKAGPRAKAERKVEAGRVAKRGTPGRR